MTDHELLVGELIRDEDLRLYPYTDTVGKLTIGVGHNLTDLGLSRPICLAILDEDMANVDRALDRNWPWWRSMPPGPRRGLQNLCFNMGAQTLAGFHTAMDRLSKGNYAGAATAFLQSRWATQVGARALRVTDLIKNG